MIDPATTLNVLTVGSIAKTDAILQDLHVEGYPHALTSPPFPRLTPPLRFLLRLPPTISKIEA